MVRPPGALAVNAPYGGYKKLPKSMAPVRVRRPEKLGANALKLYKSKYINLLEVHKTKLTNINLRNEFLRNWERRHRQNLHDTYASVPVTPGLVSQHAQVQALKARATLIRRKLDLRNELEDAGVFRS